ncbi:MAG TPA: hypothetical protein VI756_27185 [Blastocatellia bacterium]
MKCKEYRMLASAYMDRRLKPLESANFNIHSGQCGDCREYLSDLELVSGMLAGARELEVPRELHGYVMTSIGRMAAGRVTVGDRVIDYLQKLNPRLVSYSAGIMVSVMLFGLTLAGFRPITTFGGVGSIDSPYQQLATIFGSDEQYHSYNELPPDAVEPSTEHYYELPRVVRDSSLISFSNVAYRKAGDEDGAVLTEVSPDGRATIVKVLKQSSDPDVIQDLQWSLSKHPFQPALISGKPVQTRIVLFFQKMDITG